MTTEECPICFEELTNDILVTECNHSFHKECISFLENNACPICRAESENIKNTMTTVMEKMDTICDSIKLLIDDFDAGKLSGFTIAINAIQTLCEEKISIINKIFNKKHSGFIQELQEYISTLGMLLAIYGSDEELSEDEKSSSIETLIIILSNILTKTELYKTELHFQNYESDHGSDNDSDNNSDRSDNDSDELD